MALDFQQVREQVKKMGETAPQRAERLKKLRQQAREWLQQNAHDLDRMRAKVERVVRLHDASLRCALPASDPLDAACPLPPLPAPLTLLAADGSQIAPDRHAPVEYCLINVGAIQMSCGAGQPPALSIQSQLMYDQELYTQAGGAYARLTDARLALLRDMNERAVLADLAENAPAPVVTFTDGPMELWGSKDGADATEFQRSLEAYKDVLRRLHELGVATAGYVDKPGANLVVRLLEVMVTPEPELDRIRDWHPLQGVTDADLFRPLLGPAERSAVFALQSQSARNYPGPLALHFFYLNVGRPGHPWIARVEIPAWVADSGEMLAGLHAALVDQCRVLGARPYPYLLHRAHEAAVVTLEEKAQVTQMILLELRRRGVDVDDGSYKQAAKDLAGRTRR